MSDVMDFISRYSWIFSIIGWLVATWLINELTHFKTEEEWQAYVVLHPRIAFIMKVLRAVGFDRAKVVRALQILKQAAPIQGKIDALTDPEKSKTPEPMKPVEFLQPASPEPKTPDQSV